VNIRKLIIAALFLLSACAMAQQITLSPGAAPGLQLYNSKARNYPFCEIFAFMGKPPDVMAQVYNTTNASNCPPGKFIALDAKKLAAQLGADQVYLNPRRHWTVDQLWVFKAGETVDFDGVKATWVASVSPAEIKAGLQAPYAAMEIHRDSKYLFEKGKPVYLIRTPDGKVYVMQSYVTVVDRGLSIDNLSELGSKLKLPDGWKFETRKLDTDLTIDPTKAGGVAHIIQDQIQNTYEGCGFDAACNYKP